MKQRSAGGPDDQLALSAAEIALMWILHHATLPLTPQRSLVRDIVEFFPVALKAISRTESLRGARQSDLRLIYFKGLIVAQTHAKQEMIDAIRRADRELDEAMTISAAPPDAAVRRLDAQSHPADQDTLAQIADALGRPPGSVQ
ncbi:hypothetical protein SR870_12395 [Rhodopseudomonas palustris]|uniref:hypothetical protein n=1 Tax=Rhodopseudomonas palustris TaxID=1076 RepID=UPI002ACEC94B|nr:hypothetical protein [Rhodopseudomonas palustris]WQG97521.1 hypothetical protein SR870_12395 [Rhodopseudomonas palustris]